jgi:hypothetical protein
LKITAYPCWVMRNLSPQVIVGAGGCMTLVSSVGPADLGWTVVLRRQPARIVEGRPEGGYSSMFEIVCRYCGDHPDLDYRDVSPKLQRIRGPYPVAAGVAAYGIHLSLHSGWRPRAARRTIG